MHKLTVLPPPPCWYPFSSWALELDAAKQMGLVGEQTNGYLGLIASSHNEAAALVSDINQQRKQRAIRGHCQPPEHTIGEYRKTGRR